MATINNNISTKYTLVIHNGPLISSTREAYLKAQSLIKQNKKINLIFFYRDGVYNSLSISDYPNNETNMHNLWINLAEKNNIELSLCITSAKRRGISQDLILKNKFKISSLSELIANSLISDHVLNYY